MNETQLEQAIWAFLGEAPNYLKAKYDNRYKAVEAIVKRVCMMHALKRTQGVQLRASVVLGINRNTLRKMLIQQAQS